MKKRLAMMAIMCFAALSLLVGCGGGGSDPEPATTTTTTATASTASLRLVNNYSYSITDVRVALSSGSGWGVNQLSTAIAPGTTRTIINIPSGTYDLSATSSNGYTVYQYDVFFPAGATLTWTFSNAKGTLGMEIGEAVPNELNEAGDAYSPAIDGNGAPKEK